MNFSRNFKPDKTTHLYNNDNNTTTKMYNALHLNPLSALKSA